MPEPRNNLYSDMLALMDGVADISIDSWAVTYERSLLVDYSYPREFNGIHIISGARKGFSHADLVMEVYDGTSFRLIVISIVAMMITSWLLLKREGRDCSLLTCALYIFENAMYKSLNPLIVPSSIHKRAIMTLFTIYNLALNLMYMNIIISLLLSGTVRLLDATFAEISATNKPILEPDASFPSLLSFETKSVLSVGL